MSVEKLIVDHMETWTSALQTRSPPGAAVPEKLIYMALRNYVS